MTEYYIRRIGKSYELAKFEDSRYPVAVYIVTRSSCSCFAAQRGYDCKHWGIVRHHRVNTYYDGARYRKHPFRMRPTWRLN